MASPIAVSNMFMGMTPDPRAQQQNMLADLQMRNAMKAQQSQNMLGQILAGGADYETAAQQYLAAGGDPDTALKLRTLAQGQQDRVYQQEQRGWEREDRKRGNALKDIEISSNYNAMWDDLPELGPHNWKPWRAKLEKIARLGGIDTNEIPQDYDEDFVAQARKHADERKRVIETMTPEEETAAGLDPGGLYQRGKSGKITEAVKPRTPRAPVLKQVYAPDSPTFSRWESAEQAAGMPGPPVGGGITDNTIYGNIMSTARALDVQQRAAQRQWQNMHYGEPLPKELDRSFDELIAEAQKITPRGIASQPAASGPPVPGARQAKDGNWYVNQGGQWMLVEP